MLTIDMLRHGALVGGVKYRGTQDDPLTPAGRTSMDRVWQQLHRDVSLIISSPLKRCAEPAQAWATQAGIPCLMEPALQELAYGEWEGKTAVEIQQAYPGMLETWRQTPTQMTPPGGESMRSFSRRVGQCLQRLVHHYCDEHILLVAHSGSIRMLIAHALKAPVVSTRHLSMPYACWSRLEARDSGLSLCFHAREP